MNRTAEDSEDVTTSTGDQTMKAYLHGCSIRKDGRRDSFWTLEVEAKESPLPHHKLGLSFTASGYGSKIPTDKMVKYNGRWRRVYVRIFGNSGTAYITTGPDESITVSHWE